MVAMLAGHDDLHFNIALPKGSNHLVAGTAIRQKVGRRDENIFLRRGKQGFVWDANEREYLPHEKQQ